MRLVGRAAALVLFAGLLTGCAAAAAPSSAQPSSAPVVHGRSRCAGSAPVALTNLTGAAADTVEELQSTYEGKPGFLAVVFDGTQAVVVVDSASLPAWLGDVAPSGIPVSPSCVDPALLQAVKAAVPALTPADGVSSVGYDGLDDSIQVLGVGADRLLAALDRQDVALGARARDAIADGTLRINGDNLPGAR